MNPCPVDIDFGDVSIAMRNLLRKQGKKKFNPGTAAAMLFLNATDPATIKLAQARDDRLGLQGAAPRPTRVAKRFGLAQAPDAAPAGHDRQARR